MPESPPPRSLARLYWPLLDEAARVTSLRERYLEAKLPPGLHPLHLRILNLLTWSRDGRAPREIAGTLFLPPSSISLAARQMVARGWLQMGPHPEDRRTHCLWLTEA